MSHFGAWGVEKAKIHPVGAGKLKPTPHVVGLNGQIDNHSLKDAYQWEA
jgi:hypothetical protein